MKRTEGSGTSTLNDLHQNYNNDSKKYRQNLEPVYEGNDAGRQIDTITQLHFRS